MTEPSPDIQLYDSFTATKRPFEPIQEGKVGMYVCGLTVYDYMHIGHARTFILFDVIRRYLEHRGFSVKFVRNHTDVDDKIIRRANELEEDPSDLADRFVLALDEDLDRLNCKAPDLSPRVTTEIPEIIAMVESLIERGHAYEVQGDVFFDVLSFPEYGGLSNLKIEDLRAGERVEVDPRKKHSGDFALWKTVKPGEPSWDSPWGPGRPGWHIECSAMSCRYLGGSFDIHGGGRDLIFPHHENEIAQARCAGAGDFAKYWMHAGPLTIDGEKMSKSLDNFWTVRDTLKTYHPDIVRFFMLTAHYRKSISYSEEALEEARSRTIYLYSTISRLDGFIHKSEQIDPEGKYLQKELIDRFWEQVFGVMNDDFNTPRLIAAITELAKTANELMPQNLKKIKDESLLRAIIRLKSCLVSASKMIGMLSSPVDSCLDNIKQLRIKQKGLDSEQIEALIQARSQARTEKDWERADAARNKLGEMGVSIMDSADGTTWDVL